MKVKLMAFVAILTLFGSLMVACSSASTKSVEMNVDNFVGEWEFVYGNQEELSKETVELAKSLGTNAIMTLNEDGTGSFDLYGSVQNLTWSATNETEGTLTLEDNEAASMKVDGDQLELSDSAGNTLTFTRYVPSSEDVARTDSGAETPDEEIAGAAASNATNDETSSGASNETSDGTSNATPSVAPNDGASSSEQ